MIYLDNGATTWPKPPGVRQAVQRALTSFGANPGRGGYAMAASTDEAVFRVRADLAEFFGAAGPQCVCFQPGCTQAINVVLKGVLRPGDHVVISDLEHNAVLRPLEKLGEREITYTVAATVPGDSDATMDGFRRAMRPETKLVVCTQASNVWGFRLPVERLAALAHAYGARICVDAAQSAGLVPIDLADSGIDYLCCAGHKGLYGPMGIGLLVLRDPEDPPGTLVEGGTGVLSRQRAMPAEPPERFESGTGNVPGILGLGAGLDFVKARGPEKLWAAETALLAELYDRLARLPRVRLYTPRPAEPGSLPVLSFTVEGLPSEEVGRRLGRAGIAVRCGLHCAPLAHEKLGTLEEGTVRVCPCAFTRREELNTLAQRLSRM